MIELCYEYLSVRWTWVYFIIISRTSFWVNPLSIICLKGKEHLPQSSCHIWSLIDSNETGTHNQLVFKLSLNHLDMAPSDMARGSRLEFLDIQANYIVWIHSETCTWHCKNIQSNAPYI